MSWHDQNAQFNEIINQLFQKESWHKRAEAAKELGLMKDGRAVNLLCKALKSENNETVQNKIIESLGKIGNAKATMVIIEKLKEDINKGFVDKFRLTYIIESLINIKDKRALVYIGPLLNSKDEDLKKLAEKTFDIIEPNWREIIERQPKEKSFEEIFKIKI